MGKKLSEMSLEELWQLFPIILKDYNPAYPQWYLEEKEAIMKAVGPDTVCRINHIGSTAVPGLVSKPTIDILVEVDRHCDLKTLQDQLLRAGWTLMAYQDPPDFKMSFNKGYTPDGFTERVFHLHLRFQGDWDELYFRDYLLAHPDIAKAYGELKLQLQPHYKHNRDGYTQAKTEFISQWTKKARDEFKDRYRLFKPGQQDTGSNS
ncbi:MAG TPA: GrpB family protein [Bacillota bacterium]|nr:GrpB family protein [Bacillota bacterium]